MVGRGDQAQPPSEPASGFGRLLPPKQYSDEITVNILGTSGKSFKLHVGRDETVYEVMYKIFWLDRAWLHPQNIRLVFNRKQMDQDRTMDECGIDHESLIHISWRYGGSRPPLPTEPDAVAVWKPGLDALSDWRLKEQEWRVKEQEWRVREQEWRVREQALMQTIRDYSQRLQSGARK